MDGTVGVLVLALAIMGWFRGVVAQLAAALGFLGGIWAGAVVKQWVGAHWESAQPTVVFWGLAWLVSIVAALAMLSFINLLGDHASRAIQSGPAGWLDRCLGIPAGAALGIVMSSLLVLSAAQLPMGPFVERSIAQAQAPHPLLAGGAEVCRIGYRFPGARGLRRMFVSTNRRLEREAPSI